jgi:hypothetical protein
MAYESTSSEGGEFRVKTEAINYTQDIIYAWITFPPFYVNQHNPPIRGPDCSQHSNWVYVNVFYFHN